MNNIFKLFLLLALVTSNLYSAKKKRIPKKRIKKPITYNTYYGVLIGRTSLTRDISILSNNSGSKICLEDAVTCDSQTALGVANGKTYNIQEEKSYPSKQLVWGIQKGYTGNFYEISLLSDEEITEGFFVLGHTFPNFTFSKGWFIPFVKGSLGVGYTGSDSLNPTSISGSFGVGGYTILKKFKLRYGIDFKTRQWSVIKHNYGNEEWIDKESTHYLGLTYNY